MPRDVVGRSTELGVVDAFLAQARSGPATLLLEGEAGIGKTTLWEAAAAAALETGFRVLVARPTLAEKGLPLGAFTDLFAAVEEQVLDTLPAPQRSALEVALLRVDATSPPDTRTLSVAVTSLLRTLAEPSPLLVAIDDTQWLDEGSAAPLAFALRRLGDRPVGVLLSLRTEPGSAMPLGLDRALGGARLQRLRVAGLTLAALHDLLRDRLGRSFRRPELVRIHEAVRGNPFYALEVGGALFDAGGVVASNAPLPIPETLDALAGFRIRKLPEQTRMALMWAAASIEPTMDVLEHVGVGSLPESLQPAFDNGIVAWREGSLRFTHPLLAEASLTSASPPTLRRIHAALADAPVSRDARARHLGLASEGADEVAAEALQEAAAGAELRGAPLAAAELNESAAAMTPAGAEQQRAGRILSAARCYFEGGETDRAEALLTHELQTLASGRARARVLRLLGQVRSRSSSFGDAMALAQEALDAAERDAELRAGIELDLAFCAVCMNDLGGALAHATSAAALAEEVGDAGALSAALSVVAGLSFLNGLGVRDDLLRRALELEDPARGDPLELRPRWSEALIALFTHQLDRAVSSFGALWDEAKEWGRESEVPFICIYLVWGLVWRGDLEAAGRVAMESSEVSGLGEDPIARGLSLLMSGMVAGQTGDLARARDEAGEALMLFQRSQFALYTILALWTLGFAELSDGNVEKVDLMLKPVADLITTLPSADPILGVFLPDHVEALISLGRLEEAAGYIEWLERGGREHDRPWALALMGRCRALLLAAKGDLTGAAAALEAAMAEHERLQLPLDRARTLLVKGQLHRRRKEKRLAEQTLREAMRIFSDVGSPLWAEKARRDLARIGLRPSAPAELTETERRVAELAAHGLTNRQIAEQAFVSPKTVEVNLTRVYRKLGVTSRAALAARFAARTIDQN